MVVLVCTFCTVDKVPHVVWGSSAFQAAVLHLVVFMWLHKVCCGVINKLYCNQICN